MKLKTAYLGIFATVAIILGYVESFFPFPPPYKLGLANLSVLFILKKYSFREAALVSFVRILVIGFLFGNMFGILYSLAGAALSLCVMSLLLHFTDLSLISVSVAGGVFHNLGQMAVAAFVVRSGSVFLIFPTLMITGILAGILIGWLTQEVSARVHF